MIEGEQAGNIPVLGKWLKWWEANFCLKATQPIMYTILSWQKSWEEPV